MWSEGRLTEAWFFLIIFLLLYNLVVDASRVACNTHFVFTCCHLPPAMSWSGSYHCLSRRVSSPANYSFLPAMDWSGSYHCLRLVFLPAVDSSGSCHRLRLHLLRHPSCDGSEWLISLISSSPGYYGFLPAMDWSGSHDYLRLHLLWSSLCYLAIAWSSLHH